MKKLLTCAISVLLITVLIAYVVLDAKGNATQVTAKAASLEKSVPVKTGIGVISTATSNSKSAGVKTNGLVQTEITLVAVLVDDDGVIRNCVIDMGYSGINFTSKGVIDKKTYDLCNSKADLGTKYGMGANSKIGKEWYQQVAALADYVTGKTLEEVEGISIDASSGKSKEPDLMNSCTFRIADIHSAIVEAVENAKNLGATSSDKLGLGLSTAVGAGTKNAGKKSGVAETVYDFAAISYDADNKVTSSIVDEVQNDVLFSKKGVISTKMGVQVKSKQEASSKNKTWCDQSAALSDYMVGKTVDEISKINDKGYVSKSEADLSSKVTLNIENIMKAIVSTSKHVR